MLIQLDEVGTEHSYVSDSLCILERANSTEASLEANLNHHEPAGPAGLDQCSPLAKASPTLARTGQGAAGVSAFHAATRPQNPKQQ